MSSTKAPRGQRSQTSTAAALHVGPFFLILALTVSIAAFLILRGQPLSALVLVALTLVGAGLTAAATYRTVAPLSAGPSEVGSAGGGESRAVLERDKALTLRSIKELEFDHSMGKVSDADFAEMRDRLRARAVRLMIELDGRAIYRQQIERDAAAVADAVQPALPVCEACGTANDADARFCKHCGGKVSARG